MVKCDEILLDNEETLEEFRKRSGFKRPDLFELILNEEIKK